MQPTYRAILRAGVIGWVDGPPPDLPSSEVHIMVTSSARPAPAGGHPAVAALADLAAAGGPSGLGDPVQWQRETRADRPLPGREG